MYLIACVYGHHTYCKAIALVLTFDIVFGINWQYLCKKKKQVTEYIF